MKNLLAFVAGILLLTGCAQAQSNERSPAKLPTPKPGEAVANFAGGCFWALDEGMNQLKGVREVISGYAGGKTKNPTYEEVSTDLTGHAETVQVYYDPKVISYQTLADIFFTASHDPTQLNRQGNDTGPEYRSVAFYRTPEEKKIIEQTIAKVNASKQYDDKIVTQVVPFKQFWDAEDYHQGYYRLHPENPYIEAVSARKVEHVRTLFPQQLKQAL